MHLPHGISPVHRVFLLQGPKMGVWGFGVGGISAEICVLGGELVACPRHWSQAMECTERMWRGVWVGDAEGPEGEPEEEEEEEEVEGDFSGSISGKSENG